MHRRLTVAIVGAVVATLVVVGVGTLVLSHADARRQAEADLTGRVEGVTELVSQVAARRAPAIVQRLGPSIDADRMELVELDSPPADLDPAEVARLRAGETVSSRDGGRVEAAAPVLPAAGSPTRAVLAVDTVGSGLGSAGRWFVLASGAAVVLGALVAVRLANALVGPVRDLDAATRRIAAGDLGVRVAPPTGGDDEIARLVASVNTMAAELDRVQGHEREFLLAVSHDLRTPLTSISGWGEALADGTAPDPAAAGRIVVEEAHRLDRLVRDLLDLARVRARAFALAPADLDLRDVATGVAEGLRPDLEDAGLRLSVDAPATPVVVHADPDRVAQIAANLIENAGRHAATGVSVLVEVGDGTGRLAVVDDGPGVPAGEREAVFTRLYAPTRRAAVRPGAPGGTGLGLAIVRELARAMGGDAFVTDAASGGTRAVAWLPLHQAGHG